MTADILSRTQDILQEALALNDKPEPERSLEDLDVDSLDHIDLVMSLEDELGIEIKMDEYDTKVTGETTVAQLAGYLQEKVEAVG